MMRTNKVMIHDDETADFVDALNAYVNAPWKNIWQDLIFKNPLYDDRYTERLDNGMIGLTNGKVIQYQEHLGQWAEDRTVHPG